MIKDKDTKNNKGNDKENDKGMIKDKITMLYIVRIFCIVCIACIAIN